MQLLSLAQLQRSALHTGMALSLFTGLAPSLTCYEMLAAQSTLQYKPQRFLVFLADNIVGGAFALAMASWELGANRVVNVAAAVLYLAAYAWAAGGHRGWHVLGSAAALALAASACCAAVLHWRSSDDATALLGSVSTASGSVQALLPLLQLVRALPRRPLMIPAGAGIPLLASLRSPPFFPAGTHAVSPFHGSS